MDQRAAAYMARVKDGEALEDVVPALKLKIDRALFTIKGVLIVPVIAGAKLRPIPPRTTASAMSVYMFLS